MYVGNPSRKSLTITYRLLADYLLPRGLRVSIHTSDPSYKCRQDGSFVHQHISSQTDIHVERYNSDLYTLSRFCMSLFALLLLRRYIRPTIVRPYGRICTLTMDKRQGDASDCTVASMGYESASSATEMRDRRTCDNKYENLTLLIKKWVH